MSRRPVLFRVGRSIMACGIGWAAAMVATLPIVLGQVWTDTIGGWRQLLWSLAAGAGIWLGWTLAIAFGAWLCAGLPLAVVVRDERLMRHRKLAIATSVAGALAVIILKFQLWMASLPDYWTEPRLLSLYALLLLVFAAASMTAYLRLIARSRAADRNGPLPRRA